jgi:hypothetical protein
MVAMKMNVLGFSALAAIGLLGCALASGKQKKYLPPEPLTDVAKLKYEQLARGWIAKLWTNDYSQVKARVFPYRMWEDRPWFEDVRVELSFPLEGRKNSQSISIEFLGRTSEAVRYIDNSSYKKYVPTREEYKAPTPQDSQPKFTTDERARKKAEEYAHLFGVTNLWDVSKFELRQFAFSQDTWRYNLTAVINGYPSLYGVTIAIADTLRMDLQHWSNISLDIPQIIPTNVVLTAEQARTKAETYLKQYFPMKEIVPKMTFMTNSLEYMTPNYNYIRPADETGFSKYIPPKDSIALVWKNYFKRPSGLSFSSFPVIIDVDAATGEMLGGSD